MYSINYNNTFSKLPDSPINDLPEETLQHIFSFALTTNPTDIPSIRQTCKKWKNISEDLYLLKQLHKTYFVNTPVLPEEKNEKWPLILIRELIQNIKTIIPECVQINACKALLQNLPIDNIPVEIIRELNALRYFYNLKKLYYRIENYCFYLELRYKINIEKLSNFEKVELIRDRFKKCAKPKNKLDLKKAALTSLPREISLLNLQHLTLDENFLVSLPAEIGSLSNLEHLIIQKNKLHSLPEEIGQLRLIVLNLSENQLVSLPSKIGTISSLQALKVSQNQLQSLPKKIGQLSKLSILNVSRNQLKSLPSEIGNLFSLKRLYISRNKLTNLPPEIWQLKNLEYFSLSQNLLENLSPEIGNLSKLKKLDLSNNKLTSLSSEISKLSILQCLKLSGNKLTSLPSEIAKLSKLNRLTLSESQLPILPSEVSTLECLKIIPDETSE